MLLSMDLHSNANIAMNIAMQSYNIQKNHRDNLSLLPVSSCS